VSGFTCQVLPVRIFVIFRYITKTCVSEVLILSSTLIIPTMSFWNLSRPFMLSSDIVPNLERTFMDGINFPKASIDTDVDPKVCDVNKTTIDPAYDTESDSEDDDESGWKINGRTPVVNDATVLCLTEKFFGDIYCARITHPEIRMFLHCQTFYRLVYSVVKGMYSSVLVGGDDVVLLEEDCDEARKLDVIVEDMVVFTRSVFDKVCNAESKFEPLKMRMTWAEWSALLVGSVNLCKWVPPEDSTNDSILIENKTMSVTNVMKTVVLIARKLKVDPTTAPYDGMIPSCSDAAMRDAVSKTRKTPGSPKKRSGFPVNELDGKDLRVMKKPRV
jgi:hypothetical protein